MINSHIKNHKLGFTLVEWVVYLAIFFMVSGSSLGLIFSLDDLLLQYSARQSLLNSGSMIMERILLEIREADNVVLAQSVLASSTAAILSLEKNSQIIKIKKNGNSFELYKNSNLVGKLHESKVEVVSGTFYRYEADGKELIRVKLNLSATVGGQTETWLLSGAAIVRNSYGN